MGDYGFEGAGEYGGMDTNFNCLPDKEAFTNLHEDQQPKISPEVTTIEVPIRFKQHLLDKLNEIIAEVGMYDQKTTRSGEDKEIQGTGQQNDAKHAEKKHKTNQSTSNDENNCKG